MFFCLRRRGLISGNTEHIHFQVRIRLEKLGIARMFFCLRHRGACYTCTHTQMNLRKGSRCWTHIWSQSFRTCSQVFLPIPMGSSQDSSRHPPQGWRVPLHTSANEFAERVRSFSIGINTQGMIISHRNIIQEHRVINTQSVQQSTSRKQKFAAHILNESH